MALTPKEKAAKAAAKAGAEEVGVYQNGQFVRSYSAEIHGENFTQLAEEFAAQHPKREVRKIR